MNRSNYDSEIFCIDDLKVSAENKLPKMFSGFYNGGAMDLITCADNVNAYSRFRIRPRVLRNVSSLDTSTTVHGVRCKLPIGFSPTAFQELAHPDGEKATARTAAKFGVPMCLSTYSTASVEEVVRNGKEHAVAMQLSVMKSKEANLEILQRAEKAGCKAVWITVDCAQLGRRLNEAKLGFHLPEHINLPNLPADLDWRTLNVTDDRLKFDDGASWQELVEWARKSTRMEIWLKGKDVHLAVHHGVDGVIVSNHGGRQLDTVPATVDALVECVEAAGGRIPIFVDGGIRRGTDIFKALAIGASHVFIGRPVVWGLAHNGEAGVGLAVQMLADELKSCMALAGCAKISDIKREHVAILNAFGRLSKL